MRSLINTLKTSPWWLLTLYGVIAIVGVYFAARYAVVVKLTHDARQAELGQFQGPEDAERVIVEFVDYRCSYCRALHPVMKEVMARNPDVKIVYRHFPIFGSPSILEANIALSAAMQGKFSQAHDYLMSREEAVVEAEIPMIANMLGIEEDVLRAPMKGAEIGNSLLLSIDAATALGIGSTPSFLIGDLVYQLDTENPTPELFEELLVKAYGS